MHVFRLVIGLLPASRLMNRVLSRTGRHWSIHPDARLGPSVLWRVQRLTIGRGAGVGLLNVFRDMAEVTLGEDTDMGSFNWFSGTSASVSPTAPDAATFRLGRGSVLLSRHYLDCGGGIHFGEMCGLAGVRSTLLSHSVDPVRWNNKLGTIRILDRSLISTNAVILPGVTVAERVIVAARSTITTDLTESDHLYAGTPARPLRQVAHAGLFTAETLTDIPPWDAQPDAQVLPSRTWQD